tara:strand:- start:168 stop:611 length:444 start_codon:yes stop_codon:yes gene_type:complete
MSVVGEEGEMCIITIHFRCQHCDNTQPLEIKTDKAFYQIQSHYLDEDRRSITEKCEECESDQIFYHNIGQAPEVLGGTKGYVSMERWQKMNPDHYQRKEAELHKKMEDRHRKRVLDRINKDMGGSGRRQDRHEGYGKGKREEKLRND